MIINIENNPQKGPGYARITLRARSGEALPEPASPPEFMIESPGRGEFLGSGQWMQSEVKLTPDAHIYSNGAIILEVGPQVVDNLEALENYRFSIFLASGIKSGALLCKNIIPSPMQSGHTGFGSFDTKTPEPAPEPIPEPVPSPAPTIAPEPVAQPIAPQFAPQQPQEQTSVYTAPDFSQINEPPLTLPPDNSRGYSFEQLANAGPRPKSGDGEKIFIILLIIILLAALAVGAWYFLSSRGNGSNISLNGTDPAQVESSGDNGTNTTSAPDHGNGQEDPPEVQPKDSASLESLHMARGILRDNLSDNDLRRALTMMPLDDSNADANFLLREELAERGDAESMFMLGQFYDPSVNMPRGSIERDPEQALRWYRNSRSGGWQSTGPALDNLKAWLQQEIENGNPLAESLLNSME